MGTFPLRKFDECLCLRADLRQAVEKKPLSITAAQQCRHFDNASGLSFSGRNVFYFLWATGMMTALQKSKRVEGTQVTDCYYY